MDAPTPQRRCWGLLAGCARGLRCWPLPLTCYVTAFQNGGGSCRRHNSERLSPTHTAHSLSRVTSQQTDCTTSGSIDVPAHKLPFAPRELDKPSVGLISPPISNNSFITQASFSDTPLLFTATACQRTFVPVLQTVLQTVLQCTLIIT